MGPLSPRRDRAIGVLAGAAAVLALTAAPAPADSSSPTRAEYISRADPICQAAFRSKLPQPRGKRDVRGYARLFTTMGHRIGAMTDRLDFIPKPIADEFGLGNWLKALHSWSNASTGAGAALRHRNVTAYKSAIRRLSHAQKVRLNASATFGFQACR